MPFCINSWNLNNQDYQLFFKGSKSGSYLMVEKNKGHEVPVAIWEVTEYDISRLDIYEGYPDFTTKKKRPLKLIIKSEKHLFKSCTKIGH